jgi:hypothetical protein
VGLCSLLLLEGAKEMGEPAVAAISGRWVLV